MPSTSHTNTDHLLRAAPCRINHPSRAVLRAQKRNMPIISPRLIILTCAKLYILLGYVITAQIREIDLIWIIRAATRGNRRRIIVRLRALDVDEGRGDHEAAGPGAVRTCILRAVRDAFFGGRGDGEGDARADNVVKIEVEIGADLDGNAGSVAAFVG